MDTHRSQMLKTRRAHIPYLPPDIRTKHVCVIFAPSRFASRQHNGGGERQAILIWNPEDGAVLRILHGHTKSVVSLHTGNYNMICAHRAKNDKDRTTVG